MLLKDNVCIVLLITAKTRKNRLLEMKKIY